VQSQLRMSSPDPVRIALALDAQRHYLTNRLQRSSSAAASRTMFKLLLVSLISLFATPGLVLAKKDDSITHKVFFDISMDGKPAGAVRVSRPTKDPYDYFSV
jgi:hypothetical protein